MKKITAGKMKVTRKNSIRHEIPIPICFAGYRRAWKEENIENPT